MVERKVEEGRWSPKETFLILSREIFETYCRPTFYVSYSC